MGPLRPKMFSIIFMQGTFSLLKGTQKIRLYSYLEGFQNDASIIIEFLVFTVQNVFQPYFIQVSEGSNTFHAENKKTRN